MYLLAFETSFGKFSISLFKNGELVGNFASEKENDQAERLIPSIEEILSQNKIAYDDLDYIAVGTGPGSFTGVRIGLATAKGMALTCRAKLIGVSSLEASAYKTGGGKIYLNASRDEVFYQEFDGLIPLSDAALISYNGEYSPLPDATSIGHVAHQKLHAPTSLLQPLYVRKPDAKFKLRKALANDAAHLAAIHAQCFPKPWNETTILDSVVNCEALMADNLGFIIFHPLADECEIKTLAVSPQYQGKGVGSYLAEKMLDFCKGNNVRKIFLEVEENNHNAKKLYGKLGFEVFSRRKDYYGQGRDALMMQLLLS